VAVKITIPSVFRILIKALFFKGSPRSLAARRWGGVGWVVWREGGKQASRVAWFKIIRPMTTMIVVWIWAPVAIAISEFVYSARE
jgi:hypothetical protein